MGTLVEEIFSERMGKEVEAGQVVLAEVDFIMSHDNTTPLVIKAFREIGKPMRNKDKIIIHFDHAYPAPNVMVAEAQKLIVDFVKEQGIPHFFRDGVCHQVTIEEGFVKPGAIIIGGDSHTTTYGALGAFSVGLGSTEIGVAWATGKMWFKIPETILINLCGKTSRGVCAKDVMLHVAGTLGMDGATYRSLEYGGDYIDRLPVNERIVFSNMSAEIGAKCALIAPDKSTVDYIKRETKAKEPFKIMVPHKPAYEKRVDIDVSGLEPQVACHPDIDRVRPIGEVEGMPIDEVFIGTCTNGRYEDLEIAARILEGRKVNEFTRTIVTPATKRILESAIEGGLIKIFLDAGCVIGVVGCGACIGRHGGLLASGERAFTTMNRNFIGRMGSPEAQIYIGSPASAAATAIEGCIADPRKYLE